MLHGHQIEDRVFGSRKSVSPDDLGLPCEQVGEF